MDVTDYKIIKWKKIGEHYLYLLGAPLDHYIVVLHDSDDFTVLEGQFFLEYVDALHYYNRKKAEQYEEARKQIKKSVQADSNLEEV